MSPFPKATIVARGSDSVEIMHLHWLHILTLDYYYIYYPMTALRVLACASDVYISI